MASLNVTSPTQHQRPGASSSDCHNNISSSRGIAQAGASNDFATSGGHTAATLAWADHHSWEFQHAVDQLVAGIRACSWCGRVALGGRHCQLGGGWSKFQQEELPAAVLANPSAINLMTAPR